MWDTEKLLRGLCEKMEESAMEPDSVEMSGSGPNPGVAESWETVTAALVSGFPLWTPAAM